MTSSWWLTSLLAVCGSVFLTTFSFCLTNFFFILGWHSRIPPFSNVHPHSVLLSHFLRGLHASSLTGWPPRLPAGAAVVVTSPAALGSKEGDRSGPCRSAIYERSHFRCIVLTNTSSPLPIPGFFHFFPAPELFPRHFSLQQKGKVLDRRSCPSAPCHPLQHRMSPSLVSVCPATLAPLKETVSLTPLLEVSPPPCSGHMV